MRPWTIALVLPVLMHCMPWEPTSECDNPNEYRVLALADGKLFERRDAKIRCTNWSPGCSSETSQPGTAPIAPPEQFNCRCGGYSLEAEDFQLALPSAEVGTVVTLPGGSLTITKATKHYTSCAQGDYYVDYSGVFDGVIRGQTFKRGVFYAIEVK